MGKSKEEKKRLKEAKRLQKEQEKEAKRLESLQTKNISFDDLPDFIKLNVEDASKEDRKIFMSNFNK